MTGSQFCGCRVLDIHALQAVSRSPTALPGGRCPPPLYVCLFFPVPVPSLSHLSALESMAPTRPQPVRGSRISAFLFKDIPLAPDHSLSGFWGVVPEQHLSKTAEAHCRRPQKILGSRRGRGQFRLITLPSLVLCDH